METIPLKKEQIDKLVEKYTHKEGLGLTVQDWITKGAGGSQYDDRSSEINYALVREFKPQTVVEFGSRTGRCTYVITKALQKNEQDFRIFSYEIDDGLRSLAQTNMDDLFGKGLIKIGGDVTKAKNIPDGIDYLFVDNSHDMNTTVWLFETLLPKCKPGALVQIHDLPIYGDYQIAPEGHFPETYLIVSMYREKVLPLKKLYWTWEEGDKMESTWWIYEPIK